MGHARCLFSLNYERHIYAFNDILSMKFRTGFGIQKGYIASDDNKYGQRTYLPTVLNLLIGKHSHFAQAGIGYTCLFTSGLKDNTEIPAKEYPRFSGAYAASIGYRFVDDRIILQAYPTFIWEPGKGMETSFGLSIGYQF
ncbi:hypothetical protein [Flavobacterium magnum]|nr:hypothetical protein [Flavobacterium magnum]